MLAFLGDSTFSVQAPGYSVWLPSEVFFSYTAGRHSYRRREVMFRRQRVVGKIADYDWNH